MPSKRSEIAVLILRLATFPVLILAAGIFLSSLDTAYENGRETYEAWQMAGMSLGLGGGILFGWTFHDLKGASQTFWGTVTGLMMLLGLFLASTATMSI